MLIPKFENCVKKSHHAPSGTWIYSCINGKWMVTSKSKAFALTQAEDKFNRHFLKGDYNAKN